MKPVDLAAEAVDDAWDAAQWYEGQRAGLGIEFLDELENFLPVVGERHGSFPRLQDPDPALGIRRALLPRFPYGLVFIELPERIRVLAVAHLKRRPGYWLHRVFPDHE